ncbi:type I secretion C-terminal target domain-containing protein [Yoonia sp.]|uniref:type I secretion C-terminal target domain-containing protein n=1 Tax=Yoonia sp. TaxID=2212373 RepID=UPI003F4AAA28
MTAYLFDSFVYSVTKPLDNAIYSIRAKIVKTYYGPASGTFRMYSPDWATIGNIISGYNSTDSEKFAHHNPFGLRVHSITFDNVEYPLGDGNSWVSFGTQFGSMAVTTDGGFTYLSNQSSVQENHDEEFRMSLVGRNDIRFEGHFSIDAIQANSENIAADYGAYENNPNYDDAEFITQRTSISSGAMIIGWTNQDRLFGSNNADSIFGWTGPDLLVGNDGNDFLAGEYGANRLIGGRGADFFSIHASHAANELFDIIVDFSPNEGDVLGLSDVLVTADLIPEIMHQYVTFNSTPEYLDVIVDPDGPAEEYSNGIVARLEYHVGWQSGGLNAYNIATSGGLSGVVARSRNRRMQGE